MFRAAVLTVSDRAASGQRADSSGPALVERLTEAGFVVGDPTVVADDQQQIAAALRRLADGGRVDLVVTTGGTGFGPRDVTPEAVGEVVDRWTPGLDEAIRSASLKITPHAMLSRAQSGIRRRCLILSLPGSPRGAVEGLEIVLPAMPHALQLLRGPVLDAAHRYRGQAP